MRETTIISPKHWNDGEDCTHRDADGLPRIVQHLATAPSQEAANGYGLKATPSIFMPRWASRLTLEITNVRVERLQEIDGDDALKEGMDDCPTCDGWGHVNLGGDEVDCDTCQEATISFPIENYREGWDALNAKRGYSWESNPFVWVLSFRRME